MLFVFESDKLENRVSTHGGIQPYLSKTNKSSFLQTEDFEKLWILCKTNLNSDQLSNTEKGTDE